MKQVKTFFTYALILVTVSIFTIAQVAPPEHVTLRGRSDIIQFVRDDGTPEGWITSGHGYLVLMENRGGSITKLQIGGEDIVFTAGNVEKVRVNNLGAPLTVENGAHVTEGGVWTNASSRALKENISHLTNEEAMAAFEKLMPVRFNYLAEKGETYVGFIAEDVPELVATNERKNLSAMDIVAVLTKVVQQQQQQITLLQEQMNRLK